MPENDQYSDHQHNTFTPVAIVLIVAIAVVLGIFVYARSHDDATPDGGVPAINRGLVPANPAEPVVPGTNIPANPNGSG
ncbi:hypothetical protein [Aureimonas leprariae]|uniref:Uncharacterized protein n=1 Tax=Plantimonas leprariae TaxID=2615207 RepID=A0A7V7PRQ1_9HYPH|nr:hypothetical protein [Aureimonas leprariae]KAB0681420.1 hypothetical protein F6X38_05925 [Aureimonas leprariae]